MLLSTMLFFFRPFQILLIIILISVPFLCWSISNPSVNNSLCSIINVLPAFQEKVGSKSVMTLKTLLDLNLLKVFSAISYLNTKTFCYCIYLVVKMQHVFHLLPTFLTLRLIQKLSDNPKASDISSCYLGCHANPALSQQGATEHTVCSQPHEAHVKRNRCD